MLPLLGAANFVTPPIFRFWKLFTIVGLIAILGFGGWYYSSKTTSLKLDLVNINAELSIAELNNKKLETSLIEIQADLDDLEESNSDLEADVRKSKLEIEKLNAKKPEVIYIKEPPVECNKKIQWLKDETLKLKKRLIK